MKNIAVDSLKIMLLSYVAYKTYKTNGEWVQTKIQFITQSTKFFNENFQKILYKK